MVFIDKFTSISDDSTAKMFVISSFVSSNVLELSTQY